jgi:hypothetical protein
VHVLVMAEVPLMKDDEEQLAKYMPDVRKSRSLHDQREPEA